MAEHDLVPKRNHPILADTKTRVLTFAKGQIVPALSILILTYGLILWAGFGQVKAAFGAVAILILAHLVFSFIGAARKASIEKHERITQLEADLDKLRATASLEITLIETHLVPLTWRTGRCFLRVKIHNSTDIDCEVPQEYYLRLIAKGRHDKYYEYTLTQFLDLSRYYVSVYQDYIDYDEYGDMKEKQREVAREELADIRTETKLLRRGKAAYGWIGFDLYDGTIPGWQYRDEDRGERAVAQWSDEGDYLGDEVEEITERVYNTSGIQKLTLCVIDAWNKPCEGQAVSFEPLVGRRVVKKSSEKKD